MELTLILRHLQVQFLGLILYLLWMDSGGHVNLASGYHYHAATGNTTGIAQSDGHAEMIGYGMDGYGLYAQLDTSNEEPTDLDDCRGHYDDTRGYHYHVAYAGNQ